MRPDSSFVQGVSAFVRALHTKSLTAKCLAEPLQIVCVVFLWCEACAYTGRYTDAFYRKQRLDRVLDSLHFRSYFVGFYYSFLA